MNAHVENLVAQGDKNNYLSLLFAPERTRPQLLSLYAFNLEITRIADLVSEPQMGLIRQQWWLDTIDGIYDGQTQDHPVAQAMAATVKTASLPRHALRNLVLAHEFDLYDDVMPDLADLEGYLGETQAALIQMAALIIGAPAPEAAGLAGVAQGIASVLRSRNFKKYIPADMMQKLGEQQAIRQLCSHARKRLEQARVIHITSAALPAFLPASLTEMYLSRIERGDKSEVAQFWRQLKIWRAARRNSF